MKKIALSQLKADTFNPIALIEESVDIDPSHIRESCSQMKDVLSDLEALNEALFFKSEKLKKKLDSYDTNSHTDIIKNIEESLERMQIPALGDSRHILEKNKEIMELKKIQKYLRYWIEIDNNSEAVLEALLSSEVKENWIFLSELLFYSVKYRKEEEKEIFFNYSKKVEEKMVKVFQESLKSDDMIGCKAAFNCLKRLDKETLLLDEFIFSSDIFNSTIETTPPQLVKIDLDDFHLKENSFDLFIDKVADMIESNILKFYSIFGDSQKFNDYFYGKLYRTMIFRNLEKFLNVSNPLLFLLCLTSSYSKLLELGELIRMRYPQFESDIYVNEGFNQYFPKAVQKEKQFFDEIFEILLYDAKTINSYILLKEPIVFSENQVRIYEKLLCVINLMENRREMFYDEEDEKDLLKYFYRKISIILEKIVVKDNSKIDTINDLTYIYLLTRKFFTDKFNYLEFFTRKISEGIHEAFEKKIEQVTSAIKKKIDNLYFHKKDLHVSILNMVKSSIAEGESLSGKNYDAYADRILLETYHKIYKQVFLIVYSASQGQCLHSCIDDFLGYASLTNRTDMVRRFSHLKEIARLITVEPFLFNSTYEEYSGSITEKELHDLIKCRSDRDEIRKLIKQ